MPCQVSASQSGPFTRFSYFCHHISQIWCHDAISPFWSLSFCHSVHLFERPRCYACVPETCLFSIWSWSSINIYIISLSSHQRVARDRPHAIFPLKAIVSHPVCCTPPTPSSITESIRTAYFLTDFESVKIDDCRKYRAKKSGDIGSISLIQECPKNSLLLKCTILP